MNEHVNQEVETSVVKGLNSVFDELKKHGDEWDFVYMVMLAAEQWAKDCYQAQDEVLQ